MGPTFGGGIVAVRRRVTHRHKVVPAVQRALGIPPERHPRLGRPETLIGVVPRQLSARARLQVQRLAALAERKRNMAAGGIGLVEAGRLVEHLKPVLRDHRPGGNLVAHPVGLRGVVVAEEPAADVDRLVGGVVQLDPVRVRPVRMRQDLVDHHRPQFRHDPAVVGPRRTALGRAGTPGGLVLPRRPCSSIIEAISSAVNARS